MSVQYLILCPARSGSTLLRNYLASHPEIRSHGEILAGPLESSFAETLAEAERERLEALRTADAVAFLEEALEPGPARAVGLKFKYEEMAMEAFARPLAWLVEQRELRVVHLRRKNLLKRFVSAFLVSHRHHPQFNVESEDDLPGPVRIDLPIAEALADFSAVRRREERFGALFGEHPMFELTYETLCSSPGEILHELQTFLGVAPRTLASTNLKMTADDLRQVVRNYDELVERLTAAGWGDFFD